MAYPYSRLNCFIQCSSVSVYLWQETDKRLISKSDVENRSISVYISLLNTTY